MRQAVDAQALAAVVEQMACLSGCAPFLRDSLSGDLLLGTLPPDDQVHPDDRDRWHRALAGASDSFTGRIRGDAGWRRIELRARATGDHQVAGAWQDVTARQEERLDLVRYRALLASPTEWIVRETPDGRNTYVNDAYCRYRGLTAAQLTAPDFAHFATVLPDSLERFLANRALLGPDRPQITTQTQVRHRDGSTRWQVWTDMAIMDEAGTILEYQAVGREITEEKRIEQALRASEAELRAILETTPAWVTRHTPEGRYTYVNTAYCRYMGMTPEQLCAADYHDRDWIEPADLERLLAGRERLTPAQPSFTIQLAVRHPDGQPHVEEWTNTALFDGDGRLVGYQSVGRDVTATQQMQEALRASEARYRAVVDTQTEWIVRQTPDRRNTFVNPAYCRYMGMSAEQLLASDYSGLSWMQAEDIRRFEANRAALTPAEPMRTTEFAARHLDGTLHWESWTDLALFDAAGTVVEYQLIGRDITDRVRMVEELRESEARYRGVVDAQTEFVTRVRPDGRATFVNDAYCRYMGMSREALLGPDWDDLSMLAADDRARLVASWLALTPEQPHYVHETEVLLPDGRRRIEVWNQRGIFDANGRLIEVQGVGRDVTEQRATERALQQSEAQLRAILETQTEWITRQDLDSRYTFVNDAYCRYMGMSREALISADYDDYATVRPEDRARFFALRDAMTPDRPSFGCTLEVRHTDGSTRFEEWVETAVFDAAGNRVGYQAVGRDVTEKRRAQEALEASEAAMREIAEGVPLPVVIARADAPEILFCNQAATGLLDYRPGAAPDVVMRFWADPEEGRRFPELVDAHAGKGFEVRFHRADGGLGWALIHARRLTYYGQPAILSVLTDITERRRTEQALVESEQRFRRFAEAHPVPLCALRLDDWRVLFVNPAYLALFQLSWDELDRADKRSQWADPAMRTPYYERVLRDGVTHNVEVELRRKDGTTFPAALSSRLMELGGVRAVVNSVVDLGPQRAAEALIAQQREALHQSEKMGALGSLLAGVAHELNNPLSVVVGYSALLKAEARGKRLREQAVRIHTAAERCARIVKTFLAMARQKPPSFGPVDLVRTADAALELAGYSLRTSGIEVLRDLPDDLPPVHGDADQLHQVMANLVINAQQALQDSAAPRRLLIAAHVNEDHVVLEVRDNGPGMAEDVVRRIFEPFYTTKPAGIGTGLGLSVCHGIVTAHGGRIDVASEPGRGTSVTIALPTVGKEPALAAGPAAEPAADGTGRRILVVDDEREIADLVVGVLRRDGHRVEQAADGSDALRRIGGTAFDLLISDLRMPGVDGSSLLRTLRASHPALARTAIVLTGDLLSAARSPEVAGGMIMLLEKPVDLDELRRVVRARLSGGVR
ncbi:MAG: PAS domain S-box protein [Geminicoccaceae bacterium]